MKHPALVILFFLITSCGTNKIITYDDTDIHRKCWKSWYDNTVFGNNEYRVLLSVHKVESVESCDTLQEGFCKITFSIYCRNLFEGKYNGDIFDKFCSLGGYPTLIIPSLNIVETVKDGLFDVLVPVGIYDIVIIANRYHPLHYKIDCKNKMHYCVYNYLGSNAII